MENATKLSPYSDEKGRLYYYDNAKFILIVLVVLGHALAPLTSKGEPHGIYFEYMWRVINVFHMPCFIFISGFFAKSFIDKNGRIKVQRMSSYIVYYVIAQITYGLFEYFVLKNDVKFSFLQPRSILWFLFCIILWHCFLPIVERVKPEIIFPLTFIISLTFGYDPKLAGNSLIIRSITHFPIFLLGYYFTPQMFEKIFSKKGKIISIPVGLAALGFILFANVYYLPYGTHRPTINYFILNQGSYKSLLSSTALPQWLWFLPKICYYIIAAMLCYVFLAWIPRKKYYFTKFGSRTLAVYILHGLIRRPYLDLNWHLYLDKIPFIGRWAVIPISVALAFILSSYPFWYLFKLQGKIKLTKLIKKD